MNIMPGKVFQFDSEDAMATPTKKRATLVDDTEPRYPVKRARVYNQAENFRPNEYETDSESSASSENSESDYLPRYASDYSGGSSSEESDIESAPISHPKQAKRAGLDPRRKKNFSAPKTASSRNAKQSRKKKRNISDKSASLNDTVSLDSEGTFVISRGERNELINNLTRERAKRLLDRIDLPKAHELSPDERRTAHQLLTRGCMPAISRHWEKDFSTLPESLFFPDYDHEPEPNEFEFILQADKGTEFHAIRAFQELLKISGIVRDHCNILETSPEISIKRVIERYLRWALSDAHVRALPTTTPVYVIYCKKKRERAKAAFDQALKTLESLASTWRDQIPASPKPAVWPSVMGFVVCGPVLSVVTLNCDPEPQTETQGMRLLGQFDLSDLNNDVWNTLAVAISVMHVKRTMTKLAKAYKRPFIAPIFEDETMCTVDIDI